MRNRLTDQGRLDDSHAVWLPSPAGPGAATGERQVVSGERRLRIIARLADRSGGAVGELRLCEVCRDVTGLAGAGIMLLSGDLPLGSMCATGRLSELIQDLQFTLGEGPCIDAHRLGRPVMEPDLAHPAVRRWPAFSGPAIDAGVRAVFAFPMHVGGVRLGAVDFYADHPGPLTDDQHADALVMAGMAAEAVLSIQSDGSTGVLDTDIERGSNLQHVVHQAAGMVSAQLDVSVAVALLRLRSYAFGQKRLLADVAADVVARLLRFSEDDEDN
ncbi:MAG: hypothetical protein QOG43_1739 [Actinomycetota bacterium]|nr:hypothetical protein [Actinomycetota bacterium]